MSVALLPRSESRESRMGRGSQSGADPLYAEVAADLRKKIASGVWKTGDRLPPELELCETYHVSRITVRRALDELVRDHLIMRRRAKGTFVLDQFADRADDHFTLARSFSSELRERGQEAQTLWATISMERADELVARALECEVGEEAMVLRRVRGTEGHPFVYFVTRFSPVDGLPLVASCYYGSFYELLAEHGITPCDVLESLEATRPTSEVRAALGVGRSTPILKRVRMTRQVDGDFRERTDCYYIGSDYRYYVDFER